jgi:large subunit ribosomal protein L17
MRHGNKVNKLSRTAAHRRALMANLTISLIQHKRITTTLAKAKALRVYAEPIITKSKNDTTHSRRTVFAYLRDKEALKELFSTVAEKVADRPGGYTRILKIGTRAGDNAEMAMIELVDFNEYTDKIGKKEKAGKSRTRRGKTAKPTTEASIEEAVVETVEETPVVETPVEETPATEEPKAEEGNSEEKENDKAE